MSKPVPRSRLNITYRTRIEGEPKKVKLPMRFLVLGNFTGQNDALLGDRPMHSLLPGMKIDSFMHEMQVAAPIDDPELREQVVGVLSATVTGKLKKNPEEGDTSGVVKITGIGKVEGDGKDNGLGSFSGDVAIEGEAEFPLEDGQVALSGPVEVELKIKGKVEPPGDFDAGITGVVDTKIKVEIKENLASDDVDTNIDIRSPIGSEVSVDLTIPLRSINDFRPTQLAANVPEIRRLVLLQRLVLELRGYISGNPELRDMLKAELRLVKEAMKEGTAGADTSMGQLKAALTEQYPQLLVPGSKAANDSETAESETPETPETPEPEAET